MYLESDEEGKPLVVCFALLWPVHVWRGEASAEAG